MIRKRGNDVRSFSRRHFIQSGLYTLSGVLFMQPLFGNTQKYLPEAAFTLKPIGRSFQLADYYIWCSSPIWGDDGKVHLFYSRWRKERGMSGWIRGSEIAHAVADSPFDSFQHQSVVLAPREGYWDGTTCHNPLIKKIGDTYYLFYMGNANGKTDTKRIGIATAKTINGPWKRRDEPCLLPGEAGAWDDHCTTNPAFIKGDDGKYWLFYKSWNTAEYQQAKGAVRGNRKYGLAKANHPAGPYERVSENPVLDFSDQPNNAQLEDAFVWKEQGTYYMIARDMGFFNHEFGLLLSSKDGLNWSPPGVSYLAMKDYVTQPMPAAHLKRFGRLERPMLLLDPVTEKPQFLFGATQGGEYDSATTFVFEIVSYTL
ncbi:glycoside hydrolase family protein [Sphingobacterium paludis]|uniref:Glycosyl hydrolase family 43 n=1 Tax=Sphingobacterium paludis TaxID=1476465 RepID=A0A4R7D7F5_9SPHI|nr:glycoside hydrolase family protein [Sphingobacterium paludis]TDS15704.1 glycosyl hydrolase family 43 [Sphingobacterium paludis]